MKSSTTPFLLEKLCVDKEEFGQRTKKEKTTDSEEKEMKKKDPKCIYTVITELAHMTTKLRKDWSRKHWLLMHSYLYKTLVSLLYLHCLAMQPQKLNWFYFLFVVMLEPDNTCSKTSQTLAMELVIGNNVSISWRGSVFGTRPELVAISHEWSWRQRKRTKHVRQHSVVNGNGQNTRANVLWNNQL